MMAKPLAMDLRERVMADVEAGLSAAAAALKYSVSARTVFSWKSLVRENGSCRPRDGKTGPKPKLEGFREQILAKIKENPEITLAELKAKLELPASLSTIWMAMKSWGIVLKKSSARGRATAA